MSLWKFVIHPTLIPPSHVIRQPRLINKNLTHEAAGLWLYLFHVILNLQGLAYSICSRKSCWIKYLNEWFISHTTSYDFSAYVWIGRFLETRSIFSPHCLHMYYLLETLNKYVRTQWTYEDTDQVVEEVGVWRQWKKQRSYYVWILSSASSSNWSLYW